MKRPVVLAAAAVLTLTACGGESDAPEPTQPAAEEPTEQAAQPTPEATTEAADPLAQCDPDEPETSLAEAITSTSMPDTTVVEAVQEVAPHADADQTEVDVVVYLCTTGLTDEEHRTVATDLAIAARDEGTPIGEFHVDQYIAGEDGLEQGPSLSVGDFGMYTWDRDAARAPETAWEA